MGRRHFPRSEPPPVTSPRVPDVVRDKGVKLSREQRRALKGKQCCLFPSAPGETFAESRARQLAEGGVL
jgi:hypothetical protein